MERLARDHPFHTLYQLFALKNGNRGRDGQVMTSAGNVGGGMAHTADMDKVAAAEDILKRVSADPARLESAFHPFFNIDIFNTQEAGISWGMIPEKDSDRPCLCREQMLWELGELW